MSKSGPFRADIPEEALTDLRRRIVAPRLLTKELVEDRSQGVQLATMRELARYWTTEYDWRKFEARLNMSWFSVNWSPGHARIGSGVARPRAPARRAARRIRAASSLRSRSSQISVCRPARRSCGVTYPIALCSRRVL